MDDIHIAMLDVRRVKMLMRRRGFTQRALAEAMAVPPDRIANLLRWRHRPGARVLERLAHVLDVPFTDLIVRPPGLPARDRSAVLVSARRLRFLIEQRGLTLREFAQQVGFTASELQHLLQHDTTVDGRTLHRLVAGLAVSIELLSGQEIVLQPWPEQPAGATDSDSVGRRPTATTETELACDLPLSCLL